MKICGKQAQGKSCVKELYHSGYHQDNSGFKFIDDNYPDQLGNSPNGYPMNNPAFDKAAAKILERTKKNAEEAENFLQQLADLTKKL